MSLPDPGTVVIAEQWPLGCTSLPVDIFKYEHQQMLKSTEEKAALLHVYRAYWQLQESRVSDHVNDSLQGLKDGFARLLGKYV